MWLDMLRYVRLVGVVLHEGPAKPKYQSIVKATKEV